MWNFFILYVTLSVTGAETSTMVKQNNILYTVIQSYGVRILTKSKHVSASPGLLCMNNTLNSKPCSGITVWYIDTTELKTFDFSVWYSSVLFRLNLKA